MQNPDDVATDDLQYNRKQIRRSQIEDSSKTNKTCFVTLAYKGVTKKS